MSTATEPVGPVSGSKPVTERVKEMASHAADSVKGAGESVKVAAEEKLCDVQQAAERYVAQGREKVMELGQHVEDYVRKEPLKAMAVVAGVGFVAGMLLLPRGTRNRYL